MGRAAEMGSRVMVVYRIIVVLLWREIFGVMFLLIKADCCISVSLQE